MPQYCFKCPKGHETTELLSIAELTPSVMCACGESAKRDYPAEAGPPKQKSHGWWSRSLGRYVSGTREFNEGAKAAGLEPMGSWGTF